MATDGSGRRKQIATHIETGVPQLDNADSIKPSEVAEYIETMTAELQGLARNAKLGSLAYFLGIVRLEASIIVERIDSERRQQER